MCMYNNLCNVFGPTWVGPVAESSVDSAGGGTQVGSNTRVLRASSEPGRVKYTFCIYARLGLNWVGHSSEFDCPGLGRVITYQSFSPVNILGSQSIYIIDIIHFPTEARPVAARRNSRSDQTQLSLPLVGLCRLCPLPYKKRARPRGDSAGLVTPGILRTHSVFE